MLSPQMGKIIMLIINVAFLAWAYKLLMGQYEDESKYQGSVGMLYKYFHQMQDAVNKTGEGNRQLMKQGLNFIGVPLLYTLFSNWVSQRSLTASVWSIIGNAALLLIFGMLFLFSYRMIRLNEFYPDKWAQKRQWFSASGQAIAKLIASRNTLTEWEQTVSTLARNFDEQQLAGSHDYQIKQQINFIIANHEQLGRKEIGAILQLQQKLSSPVQYTDEEKLKIAMYFNQADQVVAVMADMYSKKSDEEKHQEFLVNKKTQQVTFIIIALVTLLPTLL